jgi:hypothetical protein
MLLRISTFISLFTTYLLSYHTVESNINSSEMEADLTFDLAQFVDSFDINRHRIGSNYLYIETNNDGHYKSMLDLHYTVNYRVSVFKPLSFGMGVKPLYLENDENNGFFALPATLHLKIEYPIFKVLTSLRWSYGYSPKPLTFVNGHGYSENRVELGFDLIKRGTLFFGYRDIRAEFLEHLKIDNKFSTAPYFGLRFGF